MGKLEDTSGICDEGLVKIPEACKFLGISRSKIYQLMDARQIHYVKIDNARRIPKRALVQFAEKNLDR